MSIRRILVAVDEQPVSQHAAKFGSELARSLGSELALINVNNAAVEYARAEQESKALLGHLRDRLGLPPSTREFVRTGMPAPTIVSKAKEWPADLIVIASHGRSGVARALLGSVAEGIMRSAPCPVLVVRPQPNGS
jgi:nucleotide-binding universal stress UspA family protein